MPMLLGTWDNRFFLGNSKSHINFDRHNQHFFLNIMDFLEEDKIIFITLGPGSFIGTRTINAFLMGFSMYKDYTIYGFNLLMDILPYMDKRDKKQPDNLYVFQDLSRFFYYSYFKDIENRKYNLANDEDIKTLIKTTFSIGDSSNEIIYNTHCDMNFVTIFNTMREIYHDISEEKRVFYQNLTIEYSGKFVD